MKTFSYSFLAKLFYRYGNIPLSILLLIYLAASIIGALSHWYFAFFVAINFAIIIWLNRYYIKTYRQFPFRISADNERLVCSDFFFSSKTFEIKVENIDKISGGIFNGYPTRPVYIHDSLQNRTIGFYASAGKFNELLLIIMKNINEDLYQQLIDKMKGLRSGHKE
ncbi:MAG: hypothetical protein NTX65_11835 [Ignavibacteriales bacterium]|nr:hypothetical protein [Ignavibacteriales bacterium]